MEFNIRDGEYLDYDSAKEAYLNGIRGDKFRELFNIGKSQYSRLLNRFRDDGIIIPRRGNVPINSPPKYYHKNFVHGIMYYGVYKTINGEKHYFGHYKSEAEAKQRVIELKQNNWEGLL